jgi:hypothetical protein
MRDVLRSILETKGYELEDNGNWLVASKDDTILNIGFLTKKTFDKKELDGLEGIKIIIPMDGSSFENVKDVPVLNKNELSEDFARVMFGEKDFESSIFYKVISSDGPWEAITVDRVAESGESIIKPFMSYEDVVELSKKTIKGFRYVLELVPHYLFQFNCVLRPESESIKKSGFISVNALTNKCETWEHNFETVEALDRAHTKLEPKLSEEEALELARTYAIEKSTMQIESIKEKEHTVVTEKKTIKPEDDDLEIDGKGLHYLPIWCVEGTNGVMIVNAAKGKIIEEDYYVK